MTDVSEDTEVKVAVEGEKIPLGMFVDIADNSRSWGSLCE